MDHLLKEARFRDSATKAFDKTQVTKIVCEEDKVMVLKLKDERLGPVWRLTQCQAKGGQASWSYKSQTEGLGQKEHWA